MHQGNDRGLGLREEEEELAGREIGERRDLKLVYRGKGKGYFEVSIGSGGEERYFSIFLSLT
jgi:hypothetical protein